jgi:hypothetical protein
VTWGILLKTNAGQIAGGEASYTLQWHNSKHFKKRLECIYAYGVWLRFSFLTRPGCAKLALACPLLVLRRPGNAPIW